MKLGQLRVNCRPLWCSLPLLALLGGVAWLSGASAQSGGSGAWLPPQQRPRRGWDLTGINLRRIPPPEIDRAMRAGTPRLLNVQPSEAPVQWFDMTTSPLPPLGGASSRSFDIHPFCASDGTLVFFASNREVNDREGRNPPGARFHIWAAPLDGSQVTLITGTGRFPDEVSGDQTYPAVNRVGPNRTPTLLAYVNRPSALVGEQLAVLNLSTGQRQILTGPGVPDLDPTTSEPASQLTDIRRPTFNAAGTLIAFAARRRDRAFDPLNIYVIDLTTRQIRNLTRVAGVAPPAIQINCEDPAFHPDNDTIVFAANVDAAPGFFDPDTAKTDRDLWQVPAAGITGPGSLVRVTFGTPDDREPMWNLGTASRYRSRLVFSSRGRTSFTTYNLYWLTGDTEATSVVKEVLTPDNDPLQTIAPRDRTHERFPVWTPGTNGIERILYQMDRLSDTDPNPATRLQPAQDNIGNPTNLDIWQSQVHDITPPTLVPADPTTGEIVKARNRNGQRVGSPGDTFTFEVRLREIQSRITRVCLQIKDPDSTLQDENGREHKLFTRHTVVARVDANNAPTHFVTHWLEFDCQGVSVKDPTGNTHYLGTNTGGLVYTGPGQTVLDVSEPNVRPGGPLDPGGPLINNPLRVDGQDLDGNDFGGTFGSSVRVRVPSYFPGVDDVLAWSGFQRPPKLGADSNQPPNLNNPADDDWLDLRDDGVAPDRVAGDGIWTGQWQPNFPSDFYIDVIAYDDAVDPLNPTRTSNWIIYDNVGGFSTRPLTNRATILAVMDNVLGQKWLRAGTTSQPNSRRFFRPFPSFRNGAESYILGTTSDASGPPPFLPREIFGGRLRVVPDPYWGDSVRNFLPNTLISPGFDYDVYRILSRGPLPQSVINQYLPTFQSQPADMPGTAFIQRPVPTRAVLWCAPFCGNVLVGPGSILDGNTHTLLTNYVNNGGRLWVSSSELGWALTGDDPSDNQNAPFLNQVLGARYRGDQVPPVPPVPPALFSAFVAGPIAQAVTQDPIGANRPFRERSDLPDPPFWWRNETDPDPLGHVLVFPGDGQGHAADDAGTSPLQDAFEAVPGVGVQVYVNRYVVRRAIVDPARNLDAKTAVGGGVETWGRRYLAQGDDASMNPLITMNYRSRIAHSTFCWMLSATGRGVIRDLSNQPVPGAFVEYISGTSGQVEGTGWAGNNGEYSIRGLPAAPYGVRVTAPGFQSFFKPDGATVHALQEAIVDVRLTPAAPGVISGTVRDNAGNGVPNVTIEATLQANPLFIGQRIFTAVTDSNGDYRIDPATTGTYTVIVKTFPPEFSNPRPASRQVTVLSAQTTTGVDFTLDASPGPLDVFVTKINPMTGLPEPFPGVQVTLYQGNPPQPIQPPAQFSKTTDNAGLAAFTDVPPGSVLVQATFPGFRTGVARVNIPQQRRADILMVPAPIGSVSGRVFRSIDNQPLSGVPVLLKSQDRSVVVAQTTSNPDYSFTVAQDDYWVTVDVPGRYRFLERAVTIGPEPITDFNLFLDGLPGRISGVVKERLRDGSFAPVSGATVRIFAQRTNQLVAQLQTQSDGTYVTPGPVLSDIYRIEATKFAYLPGAEVRDVFVAGNTTAPDIIMERFPDESISGVVRSAVSFEVLTGVLVEVFRSDGTKVGEATSGALNPGPPARNYLVTDIPPGETYLVRFTKPGYKRAERQVTVNPGSPAINQNALLDPEHTFTAGSHMVSAPRNFNNGDPAVVLGIPADQILAAAYDTGAGLYRYYPDPAVRFTRGRGFFLKVTSTTAFTNVGIANPPGPFDIGLPAGWSIFSSGMHNPVDLLADVEVVLEDGTTLSMLEAQSQGLVAPTIYAYDGTNYYQVSRLVAFQAYWIKTTRALTLRIRDVDAGGRAKALPDRTRERWASRPPARLAGYSRPLPADRPLLLLDRLLSLAPTGHTPRPTGALARRPGPASRVGSLRAEIPTPDRHPGA